MKKLIIILLISISSNIYSQSSPENLIKKFFVTYEKDAGKAVKELYATNKRNYMQQTNGLRE